MKESRPNISETQALQHAYAGRANDSDVGNYKTMMTS